MGNSNGLCKSCRNNENIELYNKCYDCNMYVHMCSNCHKSVFCRCRYCKKCGKLTIGIKIIEYMNLCTCNNPNYYDVLKQIKMNKRFRKDPREFKNYNEDNDKCKWIEPGGNMYYFEVLLIYLDAYFTIGVTDDTGIFLLMNSYNRNDYNLLKYQGGFWIINHEHIFKYFDIKNEFRSSGYIGSHKTKAKTGDTVGIGISKDCIYFTKNGKIIRIFTPIHIKNVCFYVCSYNNNIKINDGTQYGLLKYKHQKMLLDIIRNKYVDVRIKLIS